MLASDPRDRRYLGNHEQFFWPSIRVGACLSTATTSSAQLACGESGTTRASYRGEHHIYKGQTVFLQLTDHLGGRFLAAFVLKAGELSRGHTPRTRGSLHT